MIRSILGPAPNSDSAPRIRRCATETEALVSRVDGHRIGTILTGFSCTERDVSRVDWSARLAASCRARLVIVASTYTRVDGLASLSAHEGLLAYHEFMSACEQQARTVVSRLSSEVSVSYSLCNESLYRSLTVAASRQHFDLVVIPGWLRRRTTRVFSDRAPSTELVVHA